MCAWVALSHGRSLSFHLKFQNVQVMLLFRKKKFVLLLLTEGIGALVSTAKKENPRMPLYDFNSCEMQFRK